MPEREMHPFLIHPAKCHACRAFVRLAEVRQEIEIHKADCPWCSVPRWLNRRRTNDAGERVGMIPNPDHPGGHCPAMNSGGAFRTSGLRTQLAHAERAFHEWTYLHHCIPHKCDFGPNCEQCRTLDDPTRTYGDDYRDKRGYFAPRPTGRR